MYIMTYTNPFRSLNKTKADIAGGKGASLGEMLNAGIPVPDGFVVLSTTFDYFLNKAGLTKKIESILKEVDVKVLDSIEDASKNIQQLIKQAELSPEIAEEIFSQFESLQAEFVAVRSSATAEDGADHAWAGQLDSYLNTTTNELLENIKRCWASLFTPRAIFYRFEKNLQQQNISVAVVVQKMIDSEMSGVAFSVHPVTQDKNRLVIEAGIGLGEAIVSGQITPDNYVVEKVPRSIVDLYVEMQERGLFRANSGGNEWQKITEPKASSQVLTKEQILELAEIIVKIENHYGFPCDIEWAFADNNFYIVQSRPITTLN